MQDVARMPEPPWVDAVMRFWFKELSAAQWFASNDAIDAQIRERFLALHESLVAQDRIDAQTPREALATVIVLDQFSRNVFRGGARAYAADPVARDVSRSAIERGFDIAMTRPQRMFLYLPFEHSEDAADQLLAVDLMQQLGDAGWTRYALAHKAIIDRFGRFRTAMPNSIVFRRQEDWVLATVREVVLNRWWWALTLDLSWSAP